VLPCHRVIGADGSLTGFGGGISRKQWLLAHERDTLATDLAAEARPPRQQQFILLLR
jgi:hypothetical protein